MYPFRVFVSYAHEDEELAKRLGLHLQSMGLVNLCDRCIDPGRPFTEEIKVLVSLSHLFVPLITPNSMKRPWVHQETGFALGMRLPVLPIAVGKLPDHMIHELQAVCLDQNLDGLAAQLNEARLERIVLAAGEKAVPAFMSLEDPEERTQTVIDSCKQARDLCSASCCRRVRQIGPYSSFCVPNKPITDPIWTMREGNKPQRPFFRKTMLEMRQTLEEHARAGGCSLILDPQRESFMCDGIDARNVKLRTLLEFLESMSDDAAHVAIQPMPELRSLLMVGDWFICKSQSPRSGVGWMHAAFTCHAPKTFVEARKFDWLLNGILREQGIPLNESRRAAIAGITAILQKKA